MLKAKWMLRPCDNAEQANGGSSAASCTADEPGQQTCWHGGCDNVEQASGSSSAVGCTVDKPVGQTCWHGGWRLPQEGG